jgi:hypothetical protein
MSKLLKILTAVIGSALMVTGCKSNGSSTNSGLDDDVIPIDQVVVEEDEDDKDDPIVEKTCEHINKGSSGGSLIELSTGAHIEPNYTYTCSFSHSHTFTGEYTVKSDDRTIAQVTHAAGTNAFTVKGITPGDAIIQAYTDENELVLQMVVHVRKRIPMNQIGTRLKKVDVFYGMFDNYRLTFLDVNPIKGVLKGADDFESSKVNFKLVEGTEEKMSEGIDFNFYQFKISVDTETSSTTRTYTYMYVSTTGDLIYLYYTNGLVDIFTPEVVDIRSAK